MANIDGAFDRNATNVNVVYYLYLAAILLGITAIVGVIMAYMNRGLAPTGWTATTHFRFAASGSDCSTAVSASC